MAQKRWGNKNRVCKKCYSVGIQKPFKKTHENPNQTDSGFLLKRSLIGLQVYLVVAPLYRFFSDHIQKTAKGRQLNMKREKKKIL